MSGHGANEAMRRALEAAWPEPLLTREEAHIAAQAIGQWLDDDDGGLGETFPKEAAALESALEKLENLGENGV